MVPEQEEGGQVWEGRGISGGTLEIPNIMAENITKPSREHYKIKKKHHQEKR